MSQVFPIRHEDFDGQWNYLYFMYSSKQKAASALVFFSRSGLADFKDWKDVEQQPAFTDLQLFVGGNYWNNPQMVGQVKDVLPLSQAQDFLSGKSQFVREADLSFVNKDFKVPEKLVSKVLLENERVFDLVQLDEFNAEAPGDVQTYKEWASDYLGAEEYAVYGWAKWADDTPL